MAEYRLNSFAWAAGLVLAGLLLLLFNFDLMTRFEPLAQYVLAGLFALGGVGFLGAYISDRSNWARLIPAWTLLALAAMVFLSTVQAIDRRLIAALLFAGLAIAFGHVYLLDRSERWWAIIPGGFMLVLGIVIAISGYVERVETLAIVLFLGMAIVFFALYLLAGRRRHWWALVPGTALAVFGLFLISADNEEQYVLLPWWPLLLIGAGLISGLLAFRKQRRPKLTTHAAPRSSADKQSGAQAPPVDLAVSPPQLGEYSGPAPGAAVEILPDPDE